MRGTIYMILFPNGKKYIGQTQDFQSRKWHHENDAFNKNIAQYKYPVYRAIRKYGVDNISWIILHDSVPIDELNNLEELEISKHNSTKYRHTS